MMKKIIVKIILGLLLVSCDDYLDVNTPADAVELSDLGMRDLLAPTIQGTVYADYLAAVVVGNYTQYFGTYGYEAAGRTQLSSAWDNIYLYNLPNLITVKKLAKSLNSKHYQGVTEVLIAANIALATDMWNNVPYSQAALPTEYPFPKFDSQEKVYTAVFELIDSAISNLKATDNSAYSLGTDDLIYGGDTDKWLRAAYTLKARYQLRMLKKGLATANDVLVSVNNGFTSNEDDFKLNYSGDKINPWYQANILSRSTGNYYYAPNDQLISILNGTTYPFTSISYDPRLPAIYTNEGDSGDPWRGFMNGGDGKSSDGQSANTYYKDGGFYTSSNTPLFFITYAEAMFIKAEALFLANGGNETSVGTSADAYQAYLDGIAANMAKLGVDGTAYLADASIALGESNLMLNHIMKEKYIANIHSSETFTDFRRYNFSANVFKDLALRLDVTDNNDEEMKGKWYRRAIYPTTEKNNNENVVNANWQEPDVNVWWAE